MSGLFGVADGAAFELQVTNCPSQVTLAGCCSHLLLLLPPLFLLLLFLILYKFTPTGSGENKLRICSSH